MRIVVEAPWEKDLTVNHCRMGPEGNWHLKPHVDAWVERLAWDIFGKWCEQGRQEIEANNEKPVFVRVSFRFPDERERDSHNYFYVIANGVACGLRLGTDQYVRVREDTVRVDGQRPGFTLEITDERQT